MQKDISLYIHIPFCKSKCNYCDFFSKVIDCGFEDLQNSYVDAVCKEISFYFKKNSRQLKSVYIGGGTPGLLSIFNLSKIFTTIKKYFNSFSSDFECTIELNPDDVDDTLIDFLNESIVNRISIGVQSLNDKTLSAMNRRARSEKTLDALNCIKKRFSKRISLDLIAGYPGETMEELGNSIDKVLEFDVEHISLYSLCVEEGTKLYKMIEDSLVDYNQDYSDKSWLFAKEKIESKGYQQYEISNFSKNANSMSIHNLRYWNLKDYLGLGSGGTASLFYSDYNSLRFTNTSDIEKYISFWMNNEYAPFSFDEYFNLCEFLNKLIQQKIIEFESIDKKTEMFEYFMMNFRLLQGISKRDFEKRFNIDLESKINGENSVFNTWCKKALAQVSFTENDVFYSLNKNGILYLNNFLKDFFDLV